ncbi:type II toxin-antitoxin system HicA family toxin [Rhodococcus ruber]|uniref:type II toxin-antitoxin system HicA family toxin n=1 Tax=Rhodococcus ruber TaxID=1830 RepID=UPI00200E13EA|nr:type II toxin-antitoxin system HicA family toxin [Rhodococcus ruber]UQB71217.1 type II toxin-antitoxin system HicA family toxin [Rhodococcus ruber]
MIAEQPTRKIQKLLRESGFTPQRTSGSHEIWDGPNGTTVSVPTGHRIVSPGVVRQVNKAIAASKRE